MIRITPRNILFLRNTHIKISSTCNNSAETDPIYSRKLIFRDNKRFIFLGSQRILKIEISEIICRLKLISFGKLNI